MQRHLMFVINDEPWAIGWCCRWSCRLNPSVPITERCCVHYAKLRLHMCDDGGVCLAKFVLVGHVHMEL